MNARDHMARVGALPCVLCARLGIPQTGRTHVHHIREGQGMQQRASDWLVCALCEWCHQGPQGIHGDRGLFRIAKWGELDALAATIEALQ